MAQVVTYFNLTMKDLEQLNEALEILKTAIEKSKEDNNITDQIASFLEEMRDGINDRLLEVQESYSLSQYAYEVLFPDWFKAIAKKFPNDNYTADAFQESYTDGSTYEYTASYSKKELTLKRKLKGYITDAPICEGVINIADLKDFIFELNGVKEQPVLMPKKKKEKAGLTVKNGTLKKYVGDSDEFIVPENITAIGSKAISGCSNLKRIHISASVIKIASDALVGCDNLEEITVAEENGIYRGINNCLIQKSNGKLILGCKRSVIPTDGSVKTIGAGAFALGCPQTIIIPKSVQKIEETALSCVGVHEIMVEFGNSIYHSTGNCLIETKSKKLLFGCANSIIPNDGSVVEIDCHAFAGGDIAEIVIPDSVHNLGRDEYNGDAFKGCRYLKSVVIGNGVTFLGWQIFEDCEQLADITLGNGLKNIGMMAFHGCKTLKSIIIPDSVTMIDSDAFNECSHLTSIILPDGIEELAGGDWVNECQNLQFNEFDNALYLGSQNNPYLALMRAKNKSITSCVVHEKTKLIVDSAFKGCSKLSEVAIGNCVTMMGSETFEGCSRLQSIVIPDSVVSIQYSMFDGCKNLKIYCRARRKPNGWIDGWNGNTKVVWGYEGD